MSGDREQESEFTAEMRKLGHRAVTEGVNLNYVERMRKALYAAADKLDAERALRERAEQERDELGQAFETEVRVCSARTNMLDKSKARVSELEQALTEARDLLDGPRGDESFVRGQVIALLGAALAGVAETKEPTRDVPAEAAAFHNVCADDSANEPPDFEVDDGFGV